MKLTLAYRTRSVVTSGPSGLTVALATNLVREPVGFDGRLLDPLRFREAFAAFHDILIGDPRHRPRVRPTREVLLAGRKARRPSASARKPARGPAPPELSDDEFDRLDADFRAKRREYWATRDQYARHLTTHDARQWRLMVPCDPVLTVAPDALTFEGFAADESGSACLTLDRSAFADERDVEVGTTNVDHSWTLYEQLQTLRSHLPTRIRVGPGSVEFDRRETLDPPDHWLRSSLRLQAAMSLPMRRVVLGREALYNALAFLARHRAAKGPRAIRFELTPGRPAALVLEPWEVRIEGHGLPYDGPRAESIRVWGRDRLRAFARLLPVLDSAEVFLLGSGLPSFWSARMGGLRLTLGLSGWLADDPLGGSRLSRLAPPSDPGRYLASQVAASFRANPGQTLAQVAERSGGPEAEVLAVLYQLAGLGQVAHDLDAGLYRWRPWMTLPWTLDRLGPEDPEAVAAAEIAQTRSIRLGLDETRADGSRTLEGTILDRPVALSLDADGRMIRGHCTCSHHRLVGLRAGPCRHLLALYRKVEALGEGPASLEAWFASLRG